MKPIIECVTIPYIEMNTTNTTDTNTDPSDDKSLRSSIYLVTLLTAFTLMMYCVRRHMKQYEDEVAKAKQDIESQTFRLG